MFDRLQGGIFHFDNFRFDAQRRVQCEKEQSNAEKEKVESSGPTLMVLIGWRRCSRGSKDIELEKTTGEVRQRSTKRLWSI